MRYFYGIIYLLILGSINIQEQDIKINFNFYINSIIQEDVKYYLLKDNNEAYLLDNDNSIVSIEDLGDGTALPILAISGKHKVLFPFYEYRNAEKIDIYFDGRVFGNETKKKFGRGFFDFFFKKEYYIDISSFENIIVVFKPIQDFILIE